MNQVMRSAEIEEDARLAALGAFAILDTPPERGFDDIVHLARRLCDVPVALISLIDRDRQWFKARAGFPDCETDLDRSVCKFVLAEAEILQIPDLTRDLRTRDNPLVTGAPHLRFYAGAPLRTPDGHALGSLCVIDHAPRPGGLSPAQIEDLEALARQVMDQLLLRRSLAERDRADRQRAAVSKTLADVAAAGGDLDASLRAALAGAMRAIPAATAGAIEMRDADELVYRAVTDGLASHLGLRLPLVGSLAGSCLREDTALLVPDVHRDGRVKRDLVAALRLRSCVLVPVRRGGGTIGVLKLQSDRPGAFTDEDLRVAEIFAGTISAGLAEAGEMTARRATLQGQRRYAAVFDSAIDHAIVVMDHDGRITEWNEGATRILGWAPDEARGQPADLFFTPEDREAGIPAREMEEALRTGSGNDERWHIRKDGTWFFASGEMMVLREEDGTMAGFLKILRDRTERHEAGLRLEASHQRYRLAARATNDAVWDWDLATNHVLWNEALADAYGHDLESVEPTGDWWIAHIHPEDRSRIDASIHAVIDGTGTAWTDEYRFLRTDGSYADVLDRGNVIRDGDGRAIRMIGAMFDLTERKRAEDALQESGVRLRTVTDNVAQAVFQMDADGRITFTNPAAEAMFGWSADAMLGGSLHELLHHSYPDGRSYPEDACPLRHALQHGRLLREAEDTFFHRDGTPIRVLVTNAPVRLDGEIASAVLTVTDITGRKRAEARQAALLALGDRLRDLGTVPEMTRAAAAIVGRTLDASRAGFGQVDAETGILVLEPDWTAPGQASIAGTHRYGDYGDLLDGLRQGTPQVVADVAQDPRTASDIERWRSIGVGSLVNLPVRERGTLVAVYLVHDTRPRTWTPDEIAFLQAVADRVEVGVARLRAEERQQLLNRELSHRMKNLLAMVQSIATQSMRNAADIQEAKEVLSGRLIALSRAHDLLMGGALTSTGMEPVVRAALDLHTDHPERFRLSGPAVTIGTDQALSLALMLHELATNAAKYGALVNDDGYVAFTWERVADPKETLLRLTWTEHGGPPVAPPTRKGFGSRFIERGLVAQVNGALDLDYARSGVTCTLTAPLAEFQRGH